MTDWKEKFEKIIKKEEEREDIKDMKEKNQKTAERKRRERELNSQFFNTTVNEAFSNIEKILIETKDIEIGLPDSFGIGSRSDFIVYAKGTRAKGNYAKEYHYIISADLTQNETKITSSHHIEVRHNQIFQKGLFQLVDYRTINVDDIYKDIFEGYNLMVKEALKNS